ncbi:MAG: leucyl/phenylalanyl-tRNA--protein transferase [Flavobacteriales bacterium]|nr:leucyl/phenylalanyl-tRNA--protein transferase [Crocinitomicaceae bacterium]MBO75038.1 leucyl/phenylalanyl-tRNA--protein transferase [Flavobacteriales bacterium]
MQNAPKVALLDETISFPAIEEAWEGLLAIGGDLEEARLIAAYEHGVFPWYGENDPILWWAPEERSVLFLENLHIAKSMRSVLNSHRFELRIDTAFSQVIQTCADVRSNKEGTWISQDIIDAYIRLHELGLAHSFEAWREDRLVGGLYGISIGRMFFGESMFSLESNASKFCFIQLVQWAKKNGYGPIDCQISNSHLISMGAKNIPREAYSRLLRTHLAAGKTRRGKWTIHK